MSEPREFDLLGPLPSGITVLEASAGTGKTHTIATLAARYVADGVELDRILLVSFTRMAAGELRERVRDRMIELERGLAALAAGATVQDPVVALLDGAGDLGRARLTRAIASFDAATIVTTHSFCQEVLGGLGIAGDLEPEASFVEDLSSLTTEVLDDLYVRKYRAADARPLAFDVAATIARTAIGTFAADIHPPADGPYDERAALARRARAELERRKRRLGVMSYDDLVGRLREALTGRSGEAARGLLRGRFDVALVDEFQDTDPAQWDVLHDGFGQAGQTLVLIADPKQAIYAFRGADVYAYLAATRAAADQRTLAINWRCDQALIDAHDALFANAQLGHAGIVYRRVRAAEGHAGCLLAGAPHPAPMRVRVAMRETPEIEQTAKGFANGPSAIRFIATDLAADVAQLLGSGARAAGELVRPGHVAVLVRTNAQAEIVAGALAAAEVPAVINGAGSVFDSEAARHWLRLIEALERPSSIPRAHSAALTDFVGWSARRLAAVDDGSGDPQARDAWEDLHRRMHEWARILRGRGVASLLQAITRSEALAARLLADDDGERRLTDLRHIGQLLHVAATADSLGPTALAGWLRARINEQTGDEERTRRLESDEAAVQILTIHRSKGLEFPVVYVPFLWDRRDSDEKGPISFHDASGRFILDVSANGPGRREHIRRSLAEERGEDLRLAYVALTRARHQVVLWWAGSWNSRNAPLTRLLLARGEDGVVAPGLDRVPDDGAMLARLGTLRDAAPAATISVERADPQPGARFSPGAQRPPALDAARFERSLDLRWRRTSYTDITAGSYEASVGSEPEQPLIDDEPGTEEPLPAGGRSAEPELALPALLGEMPVGADVGTFVHSVMEACDFAAADLPAELRARIAEVRARRAVDIGDPELVVQGLSAVISTPLGDALDGRALRDLPRDDRLDELGFELPLAGGDRPGGWVTLDRIADVLRDALPAGDPLSGYAARLAGDPFLRRSVRGYLTGSLDLVARLPGAEAPRFAVLDYKTNWLGEPGEPLTAFHYRPQALLAEMHRHHYALQALLYTVALHRFLRWRLAGYDPEVHLAGVAYLFVRGMTGGGIDGSVPGVFGWRPPPGLVDALSDTLDAGVA